MPGIMPCHIPSDKHRWYRGFDGRFLHMLFSTWSKNKGRTAHVVFGFWSMKDMKTPRSDEFLIQAIEFRILKVYFLDVVFCLLLLLDVRYPQA